MTSEELEQALDHDLAQKGQDKDTPSPIVVARYCLQNAAVATRGAECALVVCKPPAVAEARQSVQMAMQSLEQALLLLAMMETPNV